MPSTSDKELRRYVHIGTAAAVAGFFIAIIGALAAHFTGLPPTDNLNIEIYPNVPRGWVYVTISQITSVGGAFLLMGGIALAYLYERPMTWARASVGAALFVTLMLFLFGIIPNEWLTLTQSTLEWTPQKILLTVPPWLVLGNEVTISYAAVKDIVSGTYAVVMLGVVAVTAYQWQERQKKAKTAPPPAPISTYGRPLTKMER